AQVPSYFRVTCVPTVNLWGVGRCGLAQYETFRFEVLWCFQRCHFLSSLSRGGASRSTVVSDWSRSVYIHAGESILKETRSETADVGSCLTDRWDLGRQCTAAAPSYYTQHINDGQGGDYYHAPP